MPRASLAGSVWRARQKHDFISRTKAHARPPATNTRRNIKLFACIPVMAIYLGKLQFDQKSEREDLAVMRVSTQHQIDVLFRPFQADG